SRRPRHDPPPSARALRASRRARRAATPAIHPSGGVSSSTSRRGARSRRRGGGGCSPPRRTRFGPTRTKGRAHPRRPEETMNGGKQSQPRHKRGRKEERERDPAPRKSTTPPAAEGGA